MIKFSANNFIGTLISIITDSPTSILFIVLGTIFTVAMIINVKKNKTIGKTLFIAGWIFIILFIIIKYNEYISKLFDNLINNVFMQIFFPNLATYIIIIVITNFIFLRTVLNKSTKTIEKIVNSMFFSTIMVLMVYTLDLIIENKINIYAQKELYTNKQVLTLIESTTIIFSGWILIIFSKFLITKLVEKSNEKIKQEYENEKNTEINQVETIPLPQSETNPVKPAQMPQTEINPIEPVTMTQTEVNPVEPIPMTQTEVNPIEPVSMPQTDINPIEPAQMPQTDINPIEPVTLPQTEINPIEPVTLPQTEVNPVEPIPLPQTETNPVESIPLPQTDIKPVEPVSMPQTDINPIEPVPLPQTDVNPVEPVTRPQTETNHVKPIPLPQTDIKPVEPVPLPQTDIKPVEPVPLPQTNINNVEPTQIIQPKIFNESIQDNLTDKPKSLVKPLSDIANSNIESKNNEEKIETLTL